jgi:hypothetical protein
MNECNDEIDEDVARSVEFSLLRMEHVVEDINAVLDSFREDLTVGDSLIVLASVTAYILANHVPDKTSALYNGYVNSLLIKSILDQAEASGEVDWEPGPAIN